MGLSSLSFAEENKNKNKNNKNTENKENANNENANNQNSKNNNNVIHTKLGKNNKNNNAGTIDFAKAYGLPFQSLVSVGARIQEARLDADPVALADLAGELAVAEKVSALRTEEYFAERAGQGDVRKALRILKRAGVGQPPVEGDELPAPSARRRARFPREHYQSASFWRLRSSEQGFFCSRQRCSIV